MSEGDFIPIKIEKETADFLNRMHKKMHTERVQMEVLVNRFEGLVKQAREAVHGK